MIDGASPDNSGNQYYLESDEPQHLPLHGPEADVHAGMDYLPGTDAAASAAYAKPHDVSPEVSPAIEQAAHALYGTISETVERSLLDRRFIDSTRGLLRPAPAPRVGAYNIDLQQLARMPDDTTFARTAGDVLERWDCPSTNDPEVYCLAMEETLTWLAANERDIDPHARMEVIRTQVAHRLAEGQAYVQTGVPPEEIHYGVYLRAKSSLYTERPSFTNVNMLAFISPPAGRVDKLGVASVLIAAGDVLASNIATLNRMGYRDVDDVVERIKRHNATTGQPLYLAPQFRNE